MRDFKDIEIARVALHVVAPQSGSLVRTEVELGLPLEDDVAEFLCKHVEHGLADSGARAAKFITPGADRAEGLTNKILCDGNELVEASSDLAQLLYNASEDERVSDGTFAAMLCSATDGPGARHDFLALLKLDPSSQYRTTTGTKDGRRIVRLARSSGILPSVNERLQKAAFIRKEHRGVEYQMLLVDRQRKADIVSEFFLVKFLGAQLIHDATTRTKILWREVINARNAIQDAVSPSELLAVDRYIHGATSGTSINLDTFQASVPITDNKVRGQFNAQLSAALPDRDFELDRVLTDKLHRRRTFEGDNGLKFSVPAEHYEDMVTVDPDPNRQGSKVVTIHTVTWDERT